MAKPEEALEHAFETAMIGGINVYVRDDLRPNGFLAKDAYDGLGGRG